MDVKPLNLESTGADIRPLDPIQAIVFDIDDPLAAHTEQMVMPADLGIESGCRAGMTDASDQSQACERVQDAISRGA